MDTLEIYTEDNLDTLKLRPLRTIIYKGQQITTENVIYRLYGCRRTKANIKAAIESELACCLWQAEMEAKDKENYQEFLKTAINSGKKIYTLNTAFMFGKYRSKTIKQVADRDAGYISWCIKNNIFVLDYDAHKYVSQHYVGDTPSWADEEFEADCWSGCTPNGL